MANDLNGGIPRWVYDRLTDHDAKLNRLADMPERIRNIGEDVKEIKESLKHHDEQSQQRFSQQRSDARQSEGLHLGIAQTVMGAFLGGIGVVSTILLIITAVEKLVHP